MQLKMQIEIKDFQVLIGPNLLFFWLMWLPAQCNSPQKCTPVKVKVRQKLMISICSFNILFNIIGYNIFLIPNFRVYFGTMLLLLFFFFFKLRRITLNHFAQCMIFSKTYLKNFENEGTMAS